MEYLAVPGLAPITSVAWGADGRLLAAASPSTSAVVVFDVRTGQSSSLRRPMATGGTTFVRWSPDGNYLFGATSTGTFLLWETKSWTSESWTTDSPCQDAVWAPDSRTLFVTLKGAATVHCLQLDRAPPTIRARLLQTIDLSSIEVSYEDGSTASVGGVIRTIALDGTGERLAVTFEPQSAVVAVDADDEVTTDAESDDGVGAAENSGNGRPTRLRADSLTGMEDDDDDDDDDANVNPMVSPRRSLIIEQSVGEGTELVVLFAINLYPLPSLALRGFVRGPAEAGFPHVVAFRPNFPRGALLSMCYTHTGKIAFVPLYFEPAKGRDVLARRSSSSGLRSVFR